MSSVIPDGGIDKPDPLSNCSVSHQSTDSLQIACNEGFSGGLPQNFLLEIFDTSLAGEGGSGPLESKTNQTSMKPVFIVRGLHADTPYVAYVTAVNAKGRSEPLLVRIVTLRPPETQKNIGSGKSEGRYSSLYRAVSNKSKNKISVTGLDLRKLEPDGCLGLSNFLYIVIYSKIIFKYSFRRNKICVIPCHQLRSSMHLLFLGTVNISPC